MRLAAYFPRHRSDLFHCHTCISICDNLRGPGLDVVLVSPTSHTNARRDFTRDAIPEPLQRVVLRFDRKGTVWARLGRRRYRLELERSEAAYLWASVPMTAYEDVRDSGRPLIMERINCHRKTIKRILDDAYERAGLAPRHPVTEAATREEDAKLALADYVFAPSPGVRDSLLDAGVPEEKILASAYGWSPHRLHLQPRADASDRPFTVLFVGTLMIRKGTHHLLKAWASSGIRGKLVLCGELTPEIEELCSAELSRSDVEHRGFVSNIGAEYAKADVFAFPTLEEGSPLVVYEAMAAGVVPIVTPMGAGSVVRDGQEGLVIGPHDVDALVAALRKLADERELTRELSKSASARAAEFTWQKVGARRREQLLAALASHPKMRAA